MTTVLWDTNATEIVKTLAAERRAAGALASGLALTLVAIADEQHVPAALDAATTAAAAHPCRLLVVVRRKLDADDRLDAEVQVGGLRGANESVVMRMYGRLTLHAESVVLPLLASDAPVVTWWHGVTPDKLAYDALSTLASRRVTDTANGEDPLKALKARAKDYAPGDTDLAWTRATPWRALLAAAFDDISDDATSAEVKAEEGNPSAALIAGWLSSRLGVKARRPTSSGPGVTAVQVRFSGGDVLRVDRPDGYLATLSRTGMPDRQLPLKRRELGDLIAEELRRLDADQPYADALSEVTGESAEHLASRPADREHIWRDPERVATRRTPPSSKSAPPKKKPAAKKAPVAAKKATATKKKATTAKRATTTKGTRERSS
ncbi:MAG: glucose-6-phosphate dehydrogenase assembly protein OpcA [Spirochaetaceae bacterium]|nr:glucose-6-phosphate dehydrogenase assembly protein OpcA [Spirochaetaceae bacterium]